ncbi:MAG TPA: ABC transporter ATP-binding protein [bacterium]
MPRRPVESKSFIGKNLETLASPLLSIKNLKVAIGPTGSAKTGWVLRGVDLSLQESERLALVGESGCGKSMTALSILHLLPDPPMKIMEGNIRFKNQDLGELSDGEWQGIRGKEMGIVFQDPGTSLNPVLQVGEQIAETLRTHLGFSRAEIRTKTHELLREVGLPDPERLLLQYPHQLSGGMCQRIMIAMAIACGPSLLIADEPTTALDVTVQTQILELLFRMTAQLGLAVLFITHNLRIVRGYADRVAILYAGQVVEEGTPEDIFDHPQHPYTEGLLESLPEFSQRGQPLFSIPGAVPSPYTLFKGCAFADRCPKVRENCRHEEPTLDEISKGHHARCFYPSKK